MKWSFNVHHVQFSSRPFSSKLYLNIVQMYGNVPYRDHSEGHTVHCREMYGIEHDSCTAQRVLLLTEVAHVELRILTFAVQCFRMCGVCFSAMHCRSFTQLSVWYIIVHLQNLPHFEFTVLVSGFFSDSDHPMFVKLKYQPNNIPTLTVNKCIVNDLV